MTARTDELEFTMDSPQVKSTSKIIEIRISFENLRIFSDFRGAYRKAFSFMSLQHYPFTTSRNFRTQKYYQQPSGSSTIPSSSNNFEIHRRTKSNKVCISLNSIFRLVIILQVFKQIMSQLPITTMSWLSRADLGLPRPTSIYSTWLQSFRPSSTSIRRWSAASVETIPPLIRRHLARLRALHVHMENVTTATSLRRMSRNLISVN